MQAEETNHAASLSGASPLHRRSASRVLSPTRRVILNELSGKVTGRHCVVVWDAENCKVPNNVTVSQMREKLKEALAGEGVIMEPPAFEKLLFAIEYINFAKLHRDTQVNIVDNSQSIQLALANIQIPDPYDLTSTRLVPLSHEKLKSADEQIKNHLHQLYERWQDRLDQLLLVVLSGDLDFWTSLIPFLDADPSAAVLLIGPKGGSSTKYMFDAMRDHAGKFEYQPYSDFMKHLFQDDSLVFQDEERAMARRESSLRHMAPPSDERQHGYGSSPPTIFEGGDHHRGNNGSMPPAKFRDDDVRVAGGGRNNRRNNNNRGGNHQRSNSVMGSDDEEASLSEGYWGGARVVAPPHPPPPPPPPPR